MHMNEVNNEPTGNPLATTSDRPIGMGAVALLVARGADCVSARRTKRLAAPGERPGAIRRRLPGDAADAGLGCHDLCVAELGSGAGWTRACDFGRSAPGHSQCSCRSGHAGCVLFRLEHVAERPPGVAGYRMVRGRGDSFGAHRRWLDCGAVIEARCAAVRTRVAADPRAFSEPAWDSANDFAVRIGAGKKSLGDRLGETRAASAGKRNHGTDARNDGSDPGA